MGSNCDKYTSELSRTMTRDIFENAYRLFIEQADKNTLSKKSHGEKLPYRKHQSSERYHRFIDNI